MIIRLTNGSEEITISLTGHGSEAFRQSLKARDVNELSALLKNSGVEPEERRDVLNEIIDRKADQLADVEADLETGEAYRADAIRELARIIELGLQLRRMNITREGLSEFAVLIGLGTADLDLPQDEVVDLG